MDFYIHFPLYSGCVYCGCDVRSGSRLANWELYPRALREMGRVCRPETARAVLLTHDHKALSKAVQRDMFWRRIKTLWVNVGGLEAALYILHRSSMLFP